MSTELRVAVDVGFTRHRVAVGLADGQLVEEFDISHDAAGLQMFFDCIGRHERRLNAAVAVAMEGYNGYARPLDRQVLQHGYRLFNVNSLKLARYKEIFPAPAKTDAIDARRMLELFQVKERVPLAREVLQEVAPVSEAHLRLKALTRRRKQLVTERMRAGQRLQANLQAVCPGLLGITGQADNLWFLNLLTCRMDLRQLPRLRRASLLALPGVGVRYAERIAAWQKTAVIAAEIDWMGPMILQDALRILQLHDQIEQLEESIEAVSADSLLARRIGSMPGFGQITRAELAGEIGAIERFADESSLALYLGMAPLDHSSGKRTAARPPKQVNVRAKAAMMIAVVRHAQCVPQSRAYYERKRAQGKTHNQAVRALGRHLVRVIWSLIKHQRDYQIAPQSA